MLFVSCLCIPVLYVSVYASLVLMFDVWGLRMEISNSAIIRYIYITLHYVYVQ